MPVVGTTALQEYWSKAKNGFARLIGINPASTTVDINLKNNAGTVLSTGTLPAATDSAAGVQTAADKAKLDGIAAGATNNTIDSALSSSSTNAVQNKAVYAALAGKAAATHNHAASEITSGTLAVARGGSGASTLSGVLYGNGASAFTAATAAQIVAVIGATAVARAISDSNGNAISTYYASKTDLANAITSALIFKGTVSSNDTISGSSYKTGWMWVVGTAGTYVGQTCEVGDTIYAVADKGSAYSASDFDVVQSNVTEMTAAEVDAICTF